jgi:hypothetical protein
MCGVLGIEHQPGDVSRKMVQSTNYVRRCLGETSFMRKRNPPEFLEPLSGQGWTAMQDPSVAVAAPRAGRLQGHYPAPLFVDAAFPADGAVLLTLAAADGLGNLRLLAAGAAESETTKAYEAFFDALGIAGPRLTTMSDRGAGVMAAVHSTGAGWVTCAWHLARIIPGARTGPPTSGSCSASPPGTDQLPGRYTRAF